MIRAKFNALGRRERMLVLGAAIVLVMVVGDWLGIEPAWSQRRQLLASMTREQDDLQDVQQRIQAMRSARRDPDAARKAQIAVLQGRLAHLEDEFAQHQRSLVAPREMGQLIDGLLKQQGGLELVALRSLPVAPLQGRPFGDGGDVSAATIARAVAAAASASTEPVVAPSPTAGGAKAAVVATPEATDSWLYVHGVQISVRGSYADMQDYLSRLEQLPRLVYWGPLEVDGKAWPSTVMTVTIYTVSLERTWWAL